MIARLKVDLHSGAGHYGHLQTLGSWFYDLQVPGQVTPGSQGSVVVQLDTLFVALCELGAYDRSSQQILEIVQRTDVTVSRAKRVAFS
jgi:hypothetical protein